MEIFEKAYAKLNLSLDIVSKMPDGYHEMKMIFQTVDICDDITIVKSDDTGIKLFTDVGYIPTDRSNIAYKAASLFLEKTGKIDCGIEIRLNKRIPVCAGMGGGSADGAAVLRGLNRMFDYPLKTEELLTIGRELGADVPFCVIGGTVLGCGRGDEMSYLPDLPDCYIVVCKPSFSVSTPTLFKRVDCRKIKLRPDTKGLIEALDSGNLNDFSRRMYNVFEDLLPVGRDIINSIKSTFYDNGALGTVMTGTGSAVFAVFDSENTAKAAFEVLSAEYAECFMARPVGKFL